MLSHFSYFGDMSRSRNLTGFLAMGVVVVIWASFALTIRAAGSSSLSSGDVALLRFVVPSLLLLPVLPGTIRRMTSQRWFWTVLILIGGGFPFLLLVQLGGGMTSAAMVGTIPPGSIPIFITLLGALMGTHFNGLRWLGVGLIATGVVIATQGSAAADPLGVTLLLTAGGMWSLYVLGVSKTGYRPLDIAVLLSVPSAAMVLVAWASGWVKVTLLSGTVLISDVVFYAVVQGVIIGICSTLLYSYAIGSIGAGRAALIGSASPVLSTLGAIPLLGESPSVGTVICLALVSAGALTANLWGKTLPETPTRSRLVSRLRVKTV